MRPKFMCGCNLFVIEVRREVDLSGFVEVLKTFCCEQLFMEVKLRKLEQLHVVFSCVVHTCSLVKNEIGICR